MSVIEEQNATATNAIHVGFDGRALGHVEPGGVERYTQEILAALKGMADVEVFVPDTRNHYAQHLWSQTVLPVHVLKASPDVLFCPAMTIPLCLSGRIPCVVTIHDLNFLNFPEHYTWAFRRYYQQLMPWVARFARRIIVPTMDQLTNVVRHYPEASKKIVAIQEGVSHRFLDRGGMREKLILAVGASNKHKNIAGLLRAYKLIEQRIPHKLIVIGGTRSVISCDTEIAEVIASIPNNRVVLAGKVSDDELIDWYNRAELFVFPSFFEGFGLPPLEAMACGCAVLSSNRSCLPEVCGDAALYFDPSRIDEMADLMLHVISHDKTRELGNRGRAHAANFTWKRAAEATYSQLLAAV